MFSKPKIFCISFQRTGTTSVGQFFVNHGYNVSTYPTSEKNKWTQKWFEGDYESILKSKEFKKNTVFEDDPWWCLDFYRFLFHKFPSAKFILVTRDPDKWFDSMVSHSNGKILGNTYIHSFVYDRLDEYKKNINTFKTDGIDNLLDLNEEHRSHYVRIYNNRNQEILDFFERNDPSRLVHTTLENPNKWQKIANFFNITINNQQDIHENKSHK
ncbi:MAG: hypothetical protein GY827_09205 [Cytophagales bacterium]|nr:hypothetical protein [Cytophagales bacterium]